MSFKTKLALKENETIFEIVLTRTLQFTICRYSLTITMFRAVVMAGFIYQDEFTTLKNDVTMIHII